ncbi:MAG: N-acetylmuramoyl-L-alanine amidase [Pseudomonadota bacterium]
MDRRKIGHEQMQRLTTGYWRFLSVLALLLAVPGVVRADQATIVSVEIDGPGWFGSETEVSIKMSAPAAMRAFTVSDPARVIIDLEQAAFAADAVGDGAGVVGAAQAGWFTTETSRLVLLLDEPAEIAAVAQSIADDHAMAVISLSPVSAMAFALQPAPPADWARAPPAAPPLRSDKPLIVLDPGHGGIDPGAVRDGVTEKDIALAFAADLAQALKSSGQFDVALTREADVYLGLRRRVELAREWDADVFLSLHANTVTEGVARGTALYTLSDEASDEAAANLAARENAADLFEAASITSESAVTRVLLDLAHRETTQRSDDLARTLLPSLRETVGVIRSRPHRSAGFAVLKAPDVPSVLIELGFLSDAQDRENMQSPEWRQNAAAGIVKGLEAWAARDERLSAALQTVTIED